MQIALTIVFYVWLIVVAYLLYRHAIGAGARARQIDILLAESNLKSADAAQKASEAAKKLAEIVAQEQKHAD